MKKVAKKKAASKGRIGPEADITLRNITSVLTVTPEAVKAWGSGPWAS